MEFSLKNTCSFYLALTTLSMILAGTLVSCQKEKQEYVNKKYNPEFIPTIDTDSVTMKISDSGRVKYKVVTKRMQTFDKAKDPHWFFPKGLYLEQYDSAYHVSSTVQADTVWNFTKRNLWKLKGNVVIKNSKGAVFKTQELYWDQTLKKIYTDKFIHIVTPDRDLKGYGMDASQDLSQYQIRKPTGVMRVKDQDL